MINLVDFKNLKDEIKLSIFDNFPIPILVLNGDKIVYYNDEILRLLNLDSNSLPIGSKITKILYKEDIEQFSTDLNEIYKNKNRIFKEKSYRFNIKDEKEPRWFSLSYMKYKFHFYSKNDQIEHDEYIIFIISYETEKKKAQLTLIQTHRLASIGELTYGIAHEINNPLFAILNYANLIKDSIEKDFNITTKSEEYVFLENIINESKRISNIIRNLSDFTLKAEEKVFRPTNVQDLISDVEKLLTYDIKHSHLKLIKDIEENIPKILLQQYRMEQALFNIILNAIQSLNLSQKEEKKIIIKVYTENNLNNNFLIIKIYDNGIGIPEEDLPKIFTPFFTTKRDLKCVGLGLYLVYNIIKDHNGTITVDSKAGEWTEFKLSIPIILYKEENLIENEDL